MGAKRKGGVLQRLERRCRRHKAAQYNGPWHPDALVGQIELSDGVLAQQNHWNAAEIGQRRVLEDNLGHTLGAIAGDVVAPDTVQNGSQKEASAGAGGRERACYDVLDAREGGVRLQEVGDDLGALHLERVVSQTAQGGRMGASAGIDSREKSVWRRT